LCGGGGWGGWGGVGLVGFFFFGYGVVLGTWVVGGCFLPQKKKKKHHPPPPPTNQPRKPQKKNPKGGRLWLVFVFILFGGVFFGVGGFFCGCGGLWETFFLLQQPQSAKFDQGGKAGKSYCGANSAFLTGTGPLKTSGAERGREARPSSGEGKFREKSYRSQTKPTGGG